MTFLHTILLGIIEGATEFLPISSTAHLLIAERALQISAGELFNIAVQLGAIVAVIAYAPRRLLMSRKTQYAIVLAFIPTAIIGLILKKYLSILQGNIWFSIVALFVGGIVMLVLERSWRPREELTIDQVPTKSLFRIGVFQSIAMIPGVSRSAATIYGGLYEGMTRKEAVAFSFFLAVPTMAAATFLSLIKYNGALTMDVLTPVLIGGAAAFVTALLVIHAFMTWIEKHGFKLFAWYRIALASVLAVMVLGHWF